MPFDRGTNGSDRRSFAEVLAAQVPDWCDDPLRAFFTSSYLTFDTGDLCKLSSILYDEGLEVRFGQVALAISVGAAATVTVETGSGSPFTADRVVVAVPLGGLKVETMSFDPPLDNHHRTVIESVGFSAVNKFLFTWQDSFWDDSDYLVMTSPQPDLFSWILNVNSLHPGSHALMSFAYADQHTTSPRCTVPT